MLSLGLLLAAHLAVLAALRARPPGLGLLLAWAWTLLSSAGAWRLAEPLPASARVLVHSVSTFLALKGVVHAAWLRTGSAPLPPMAFAVWTLLWVGMRPMPFRVLGGPPLPGSLGLLASGTLVLGATASAWLLLAGWWQSGAPVLLVSVLQLLGAYGLLRYGLFRAAAGVHGLLGVEAGPVFRDPEGARSLTQFWAQRWNRPFSEMLQAAVMRPLSPRLGRRGAVVACFLFSGLLHEWALSVPVGGGYGLPTLYFAGQLALLGLEHRLRVRGAGPERWGLAGRAWTLGWAALPAVLVFHPAFVAGALHPLLGPRP